MSNEMVQSPSTPASAATVGDVVLEGIGLSRIYKQGSIEVRALDGVDVAITRGEFTSLVGPSGSGKSTLLNLLGLLDKPDKGDVRVNGDSTAGLSRSAAAEFRLANIGFIFQAYNLLPVLTAYENAEYTLLLRGVPKAERRSVVMPLLERVGLAGLSDRRPHELSGGQQQRVAVARALASKPGVILADEPTANLDTETSNSLLDLMTELNQEHHQTFVFASHDDRVVKRSRRVIRLVDGRIERDEYFDAV